MSFIGVVFFYKLQERPSTNKKITTHFITSFTLLQWSGTKTARYACSSHLENPSLVGYNLLQQSPRANLT